MLYFSEHEVCSTFCSLYNTKKSYTSTTSSTTTASKMILVYGATNNELGLKATYVPLSHSWGKLLHAQCF